MTKLNQAVEIVKNIPNSPDLLLCGVEGVDQANYHFSVAHYEGHISEKNNVQNVFGNRPFFYNILSFRNNQAFRYESGTGHYYEFEGQPRFKRLAPLFTGKNYEQQQVAKPDSIYYCSEDSVNVLVSIPPDNLRHLLFDSNCLVVSFDKYNPLAVKIEDNSFLARVGENDLSNVSFSGPEFVDLVVKALSKHTKQVSLQSSKVDCSKLSVKQLQLISGSASNAKKGTLIYDEESDCVKFYNGKEWKVLKWQNENQAE
jgi:hypothetical protein